MVSENYFLLYGSISLSQYAAQGLEKVLAMIHSRLASLLLQLNNYLQHDSGKI